jgi:diaminopimelate epimerase
MLKKFIKYQSLGNNFVFFDWYQEPQNVIQEKLGAQEWASFVRKLCDRNIGVGADGVLILKKHAQENCVSPSVVSDCASNRIESMDSEKNIPEMLIFNADGTQAESCLNGLRCVTHYLVTHYKFPEKFSIKLGKRIIACVIEREQTKPENLLITNTIGYIECQGEKTVSIPTEPISSFHGHIVSVGNPHFIIFKQISLDWLTQYGVLLESHELFPNKSNIEFVWEEPVKNTGSIRRYNVLVYERGCGITQACSSGAAAITGLLYNLKKITPHQKIELIMLGGSVISWVDDHGQVFLQAGAQSVFSGTLHS